jgi:hypothetical protein
MSDVFMILDDLGRNVASLRESLSPLRALAGKDGPFPMAGKPARKSSRRRRAHRVGSSKPGRRAKVGAAPTRRRKPLSAKVRALRKQQGRYMGLVRNLSPAQKAKVKTAREAKGIEEAVKLASSMRTS